MFACFPSAFPPSYSSFTPNSFGGYPYTGWGGGFGHPYSPLSTPPLLPYNPLATPYATYPVLSHSLGYDTFHRYPHGLDVSCPWFWMLTVPTGLLTLAVINFQLEELRGRRWR
ncbi:MAG: hypothetical protein ACKO34_07775 [Vampirovibrionales bacterium]